MSARKNNQAAEVKRFLSAAGRKGGAAIKKKYGPDYYHDIGRKGAMKRWGKTPKKRLAKTK